MAPSSTDNPSPTAAGAVFLSYAREDRAAARRIVDALRGFGVEVWFDESELRGGDAWDASIRKQIRACALFLPLISAQTESRHEGYFRREWNLAVERSLDMAHDAAFIIPVVIDDTPDAAARVPDKFRTVQWTRLPNGAPNPHFVEHVRGLLDGGRKVASVRDARGAATSHSVASAAGPEGAPRRERAFPRWAIAGFGVAIFAAVAFFALRPKTNESAASAPNSQLRTPNSKLADLAPAKSVAVLAFADLSQEKDGEYFSDGISEELLNVLAKIPGLRVAARTSAFSFKGRNVPIKQVAQELGVAYVVEGSVRKAGGRVRITAQLVSAADGFHVWSDNFDRDLKDIFAVQDEIAGLIAKNLQLSLGDAPRVTKIVNPEAHRLVLEGRQFWNLRTDEGYTRAEIAFTKALQIDPQFAEAHAGLAGVCVIRAYYRQTEGYTDTADDTKRARMEAERAVQLDPSLAEAHAILAYILMLDGNLAESGRRFQQALALNPNSAVAHMWHGVLQENQGRLDACLVERKKVTELDPLWFINLLGLALDLGHARRYAAALEVSERAAALRTDMFIPLDGTRANLLLALGHKNDAVETARFIRQKLDALPRWSADAYAVSTLKQAGLQQEAADYAAQLFIKLPRDSHVRGIVLGALGRFDEALPFLERTPPSRIRDLYWDTMWDPWRDDPRFLQLMAKLGRAEEYKVARETLARMLQEQTAKK